MKLCGLDIGTTKVAAIVGSLEEDGSLRIEGIGEAESQGMRKGVVVNVEKTVRSVEQALHDVEVIAGEGVESVYASIAGGHIKGLSSRGQVGCSFGREISPADVDRVIDAAKAVSIPLDREIIHIIPREFIVDGQDGIHDPVGMSGVRLESEVYIITGAQASIKNLVSSVNKAGLDVQDVVLQPLASALSVLSKDEREMGCVVLDIGGGTTDIGVFIDGTLWHTDTVLVGGENVTKDLVAKLRTPYSEAEKIKIRHGAAIVDMVERGQEVEVPTVGSRSIEKIPRELLVDVIGPRLEELFAIVGDELKKTGLLPLISGGIVLTGGTASTPGIVQLAEQMLQLPARVGKPQGLKGISDLVDSPRYATAVGLLIYAKEQMEEGGPRERLSGTGALKHATDSMTRWLKDFIKS